MAGGKKKELAPRAQMAILTSLGNRTSSSVGKCTDVYIQDKCNYALLGLTVQRGSNLKNFQTGEFQLVEGHHYLLH